MTGSPDEVLDAWKHISTTSCQPAMDMEHGFVVTAWRSPHDLLQVRGDLFSSDTIRKQRALHKIFAWRARKPNSLPLLLDSTADIADVIIQDEKGHLKHNALRLLYAAALSRFVTGLADTQIELVRDRPCWFPPGKCLQLPSSLLELRHRIVHRHLPSLVELKRAAKESLAWLQEWYWSQLDDAFSPPKKKDGEEKEGLVPAAAVKENLRALLKAYKEERDSEIQTGSQETKAAHTALTSYRTQLAVGGASDSSIKTHSLLLKLIVEERIILPTNSKLDPSMSGAFLVWDSFLTTICLAWSETSVMPLLLSRVVEAMNAPLLFQARTNTSKDSVKEAMHDWLAHILTSDEWKHVRGGQGPRLIEDVLVNLFLTPSSWSLKLAATLLQDRDRVLNHKQWQAILNAATSDDDSPPVTQGQMRPNMVDSPREDAMTESPHPALDVQVKHPGAMTFGEKLAGPRKAAGMWKPRPIGWMPEGWED